MTKLRRAWRAAVGVLLAGGVACSDAAPHESRPLVMVSVRPQQYVVDRLAGDRVRTEVMIPPGASPHLYEPTVVQLRLLHEADLYVKVGHPHFPFERVWLDRLLAETPDLHVVDSSAGIESRAEDPHVWLAPRHVEAMAVAIEIALEDLLPGERETLRANLAAFRAEIDALDAEIRAILADKRGRRFLVFHPAWGYFAEAYGLEQIAVEQERKEPDARELAALIERARREGIRVIFVQPQFDPSAAETLAREVGARIEPLDPLAYDWAENLRRAARALDAGLAS